MNENVTKWICGFNPGATYPAPWGDVDLSDCVYRDGKRRLEIGPNIIRATNAFLQGKAFVAITTANDMLVEMPLDDGKHIEALVYDMRTGETKAAVYDCDTKALSPLCMSEHSGCGMVLLFLMLQYLYATLKSRTSKLQPSDTLESLVGSPLSKSDGLTTGADAAPFQASFMILVACLDCWLRDNGVFAPDRTWRWGYLGELTYLDGQAPNVAVSDSGIVGAPLDWDEIKSYSKKQDAAITLRAIRALRLMSAEGVAAEPVLFHMPGAQSDDAQQEAKMKRNETMSIEELRGKYQLSIHPLTNEEQEMVPVLDTNYVCDAKIVKIAEIIHADWHLPLTDLAPNIILEGDSGSGKTAATKFLSYVWGIPRTKMTMSPTFDSDNLVGAHYPVFNNVEDWKISETDKAALLAVQDALEAVSANSNDGQAPDVLTALRRGLAQDGVRELIRLSYGIPTIEEIMMDPESAWAKLGHSNAPPAEDAIKVEADRRFENATYRLLAILSEQMRDGGVSYRFVPSELMKAFQNGWLVEIQEAASVLRPGVLTELNSLLEPNGRIELPNGQYIVRHPDTIVIITTNRDYAGNMDINESLRDRCVLGEKMDLPPAPVMAARAMAQTGFDVESEAIWAAEAVLAVMESAKSRNIRGVFGMRSLIAWMLDLKRGDYSTEAFMRRVVYKMTTRDEDVEMLKDAYEGNCKFATKGFRGRKAARK